MKAMLFETIRVEDGHLCHLDFHEERLNCSRRALFPQAAPISLHCAIDIPPEFQKGIVRCRVDAAAEVTQIRFSPYQLKIIKQVVLIESAIEYPHKYSDRQALDALLQSYSDSDEVLIARDGYIRDASIANVAFYADGSWYTPDVPLLPGTTRARMIAEKALIPRAIHKDDLGRYESVVFLNAMRGFDPSTAISVNAIVNS